MIQITHEELDQFDFTLSCLTLLKIFHEAGVDVKKELPISARTMHMTLIAMQVLFNLPICYFHIYLMLKSMVLHARHCRTAMCFQ